jgi:hypothetical protein
MVQVLAVRDNETRKVVVCEELPKDHEPAKTYADARQKYPAPRYEVVLGGAPSLDNFLQNYPRFRQEGTKPAAGETKPPAGETKGPPAATQGPAGKTPPGPPIAPAPPSKDTPA